MKKGIVLLICSLGFSWPHSYVLKTAHAFPINNKYEDTGTITGAQQILTKDPDHDGMRDSILCSSEAGTFTVKLSSRHFRSISINAFNGDMGYRNIASAQSGFEFIYGPAKAPYRYQFWCDKPSKKIRLIGINHRETAFAGRETGEISANLLTNQFIAEWIRWEGPDVKPNKQIFKSEIHYPKIYLTRLEQFSIDKFDEKLMWSIGKAKGAWKKSTSIATQQPQRFPLNTSMEFTGTIAGQSVLVQLTDTENGLIGRYKYLKIGKIIPLDGVIDSQHGNVLELEEGEEQANIPRPVWRAVYRQDSLVGKWKSADKKKTYTIRLAEKKEKAPLIRFQPIEKDTVVYSNPKDTTSSKFTYHNSILQAKGNRELSRWLNAEIKKSYQTYKPQYSIIENMTRDMKDQILVYIESAADADDPKWPSWNWDFDNTVYNTYQERGFLTLYTSGYEFLGGAHGNAWEVYDNYDIQHRKKLQLSDLITIDSAKIGTLLEKKFRQDYDVPNRTSLKEFGLFENRIKPNNNFYFDDWGLTFVYNQYEIGPYVLGIIELFIPWNELKPYLKSMFMERMGLNY